MTEPSDLGELAGVDTCDFPDLPKLDAVEELTKGIPDFPAAPA